MSKTKENDSAMKNLAKRIGKVNSVAGEKFGKVYKGKRYLPILIMSTQGDLNQAFLVGLNDALKRNKLTELSPETYYTYAVSMISRWENEYPDTYAKYQELLKERKKSASSVLSALKNCDADTLDVFRDIYPELTSGSVFNPLVAPEVLPMYKNIADKLVEEYDYAGIYIVFDEFSKYIEGQNKKSTGNNMKLIEAGTRQPGIQTYQKMAAVLEADFVIENLTGTVIGDCTARAQKVFLKSTEEQAVYLVQVLEYMAENMKMIE